uniref:Leukocyte antigen CD37 n=1 Tax=Oryctolagus cuniculus TaxID=9986 RepID=A0A5F9CC26_RABIT
MQTPEMGVGVGGGQGPERKPRESEEGGGEEADKDPGQGKGHRGAELNAGREVRVSVRSAAGQGLPWALRAQGHAQAAQDPVKARPEPWRPGRRDFRPWPWCPAIPRPLRCWSGQVRGRGRSSLVSSERGWGRGLGTSSFSVSSFLSATPPLSLSLCTPPAAAVFLPVPRSPTPLLSGPSSWSLTPPGEHVGPGELPQPHQILPLRLQPLLLCELPLPSPAWPLLQPRDLRTLPPAHPPTPPSSPQVLGSLIFCFGIWILIDKTSFVSFVGLSFVPLQIWSKVLAISGILTMGLALLGCVGALKELRCLLGLYFGMLLLLFATQITLGILISTQRVRLERKVQDVVLDTIRNYRADPEETAAEESWDYVQFQLRCCGWHSPQDWFGVLRGNESEAHRVPCSCYNSSATNDSAALDKVFFPQLGRLGPRSRPRHNTDLCVVQKNGYIYREGCAQSLQKWLHNNLISIVGICLAVGLLELGFMTLSIFLCRKGRSGAGAVLADVHKQVPLVLVHCIGRLHEG